MLLRDYGAKALKIAILLTSLVLLSATVATAAPGAKGNDDPVPGVCEPDLECVAGSDASGDDCDPEVDESCLDGIAFDEDQPADDPEADDEVAAGDEDFAGDEAGNEAELGDGDDVADGGEGDDNLRGGRGADRLKGGRGNDHLIGGPGADEADGGAGNDVVEGNAGPDLLLGGPGKDKLLGGNGKDFLRARDGKRDVVRCGPGRDRANVDRFDVVRGCERVRRR